MLDNLSINGGLATFDLAVPKAEPVAKATHDHGQMMISLIRDNRTVFKILASCNGAHASYVASLLAEQQLTEIDAIYAMAYCYGFGCFACTLAFDRTERRAGTAGALEARYVETFDEPTFNPRAADGRSVRLFTIDMDTWVVCDCT